MPKGQSNNNAMPPLPQSLGYNPSQMTMQQQLQQQQHQQQQQQAAAAAAAQQQQQQQFPGVAPHRNGEINEARNK